RLTCRLVASALMTTTGAGADPICEAWTLPFRRMSILNGKMVSSTVFIFATKSGYTAFRKKQGLFHTMKIPHLRGGELQDAGSQMSILQSRLLAYAGGNWPELAFLTGTRFAFVMSVSAPQERDFIEHVLLEPFQPEINDRSDKERDHLRENKPADDH